ncbi:MAG: hypothetical protein CM15mP83_4430 [Flavobacteriaceae bacterium]|nr:MAG: hypothetical protein CM15mP83_4430 [Flavobacteriaceae bacterium]
MRLNNRLASASVSVSQVQDVYNNIEKSLMVSLKRTEMSCLQVISLLCN